MERFTEYAAAKKGMKGALNQVVAGGSDVYAETRVQILEALAGLLAAGVEAGVLRSDVTADDVWRAMGPVWMTDDPRADPHALAAADGRVAAHCGLDARRAPPPPPPRP